MAKVTLTIDDCDDGVKLTLESDPSFDMSDDENNTDAQIAGLIAMRAIQDAGDPQPHPALASLHALKSRDAVREGIRREHLDRDSEAPCGCKAPCTC